MNTMIIALGIELLLSVLCVGLREWDWLNRLLIAGFVTVLAMVYRWLGGV